MASRCSVPEGIVPVAPIALGIVQEIVQVIDWAIVPGIAVAIASEIVAATGRARRIAPGAVAIAPGQAAEIAPRRPIVAAAVRAQIAAAVAAGQ